MLKNTNGYLLSAVEAAKRLGIAVPQYFSTYSKSLEIEQNQNRETSLLRGKPH